MSKIPYYFNLPIPKFFWESGWLDINHVTQEMYFKRLSFLTWSFGKCSIYPKREFVVCKEIDLEPFEFACGRRTGAQECFLTEDEFRTQLKVLVKIGILKKTPNSLPNRFNCYIWVTSHFSEFNPQPNPRSIPNRSPTASPRTRLATPDCRLETATRNGVVSLDCMEKFQVSAQNQKNILAITNDHSRIEEVINWAFDPKNGRNSPIASAIDALKNNYVLSKKPYREEVLEKFKHGEKYNEAECFIENDVIAFSRGMSHGQVKLNSKNFKNELDKVLKKFQIDVRI